VQHLVTATGFPRRDVLDAVTVLKSIESPPGAWPDEAIVRALPRLAEMAACASVSLRVVAGHVREAAALAIVGGANLNDPVKPLA
jgi:hypothetical protein